MSASTKVFISYSTKDTELSNNICSALEKSDFNCWIAPRDIKPGEDWAEAIIDGIDSSDYLVCVLTESANESVQVKREIERAVSKKISIIPFKVGDFELSKSMQYFLSSHHWLNVDENNVDASILLLIEKLTGKKSEAPKTEKITSEQAKKPVPAPSPETTVNKKSPAPAIAVIIAIILAFSAYFFFIKDDSKEALTEDKEIIPANTIEETIEPVDDQETVIVDPVPETVVDDLNPNALKMPQTLGDGFKMITNPELTFDDRGKVKTHVLTMFSDNEAQVNVNR